MPCCFSNFVYEAYSPADLDRGIRDRANCGISADDNQLREFSVDSEMHLLYRLPGRGHIL